MNLTAGALQGVGNLVLFSHCGVTSENAVLVILEGLFHFEGVVLFV